VLLAGRWRGGKIGARGLGGDTVDAEVGLTLLVLEAMTCCSACSYDIFFVRIASGNALVCGFENAFGFGYMLCFGRVWAFGKAF